MTPQPSLPSRPLRRLTVTITLIALITAGCSDDKSSNDTSATTDSQGTTEAPDTTAASTVESTAPSTTVTDAESEFAGEFNIAFEGEEHSFAVVSCETTPEGELLVIAESAAGARSGDASISVPARFLVPGTHHLDRSVLASDAEDPDNAVFVAIFFEGASSYDEISGDGWDLTINDDLNSGSFVAVGPEVASGDFSCA